MKKQDIYFIIGTILFFAPFFIFSEVYDFYKSFNQEHGMIMSFIKFSILATTGECIGLRIKTGKYYQKGFGIIPHMIVWGFLGLAIKMSFIIFTGGTIDFLSYMGMENVGNSLNSTGLSGQKIFIAFCISALMNTIFAPIFMTIHKITDTHILNNGGTIKGFFKPIKMREIMVNLNWDVQWSFVFKKTIPFFWIPAHTITFCLPDEWQILFAAFLGIVLGVILSIASMKGNK